MRYRPSMMKHFAKIKALHLNNQQKPSSSDEEYFADFNEQLGPVANKK